MERPAEHGGADRLRLLDRFPDLRITSLECGHGWLAFWASRLDEQAEMSQHALPRLKSKPSEYIRGPQYFQSIQLHEGELSLRQALEAIGEDTLDVRDGLSRTRRAGSRSRWTPC